MQELTPELLDALADRIAVRLAGQFSALEPQTRLVDVYRLSEVIGLSVPTIHRGVAAGTIPSIKHGARRLFVVSEVIEALRDETTRAQQA